MIYVLLLVVVAVILIIALFRFGVKQKLDEYDQINKYFADN
jgi:hypothetical protein